MTFANAIMVKFPAIGKFATVLRISNACRFSFPELVVRFILAAKMKVSKPTLLQLAFSRHLYQLLLEETQ